MTKSTITRERLLEIAEDGFLKHGESKELARMALAAMDSEPIYQYRIRNGYNGQVTEWQTIRPDQVDFVIKAQPINAEFRIIAAQHKSPVILDGYVIVPKVPTEDMIVAGFESEPDETFSEPEVWEEYQNMSGCQQAAHRARLCWAAMLAVIPPAPKN
ncbi:hypothetical protein [Klebsiella aerogenes]|uniref:hypothetical protein n=1 Tax=Klebsiella aerogenes TaxID=548 RepID=UPI001E52A212|nr:hypothetical protein [Klebsiella aerogenes]